MPFRGSFSPMQTPTSCWVRWLGVSLERIDFELFVICKYLGADSNSKWMVLWGKVRPDDDGLPGIANRTFEVFALRSKSKSLAKRGQLTSEHAPLPAVFGP
eukprot:6464702-Amphidinium_carterae.1